MQLAGAALCHRAHTRACAPPPHLCHSWAPPPVGQGSISATSPQQCLQHIPGLTSLRPREQLCWGHTVPSQPQEALGKPREGPWGGGGLQRSLLQNLTCDISWKRSICSLPTTAISLKGLSKWCWLWARTHLSLSPAQRRYQVKGPQAVPVSEIPCQTTVNSTGLHPLQALAYKSRWERAGQGKGTLWGCGVALPSCLGGILHIPEQDSGKRPYTFAVTLENPFQHEMGTKCGAGSTVKWDDFSLIKINTAIWKSLDKWATWDDLFSVMLLGDIIVVNHKTINCCYSGILLINTSILKSISVKVKLLMGSCQFWQKQATKPTFGVVFSGSRWNMWSIKCNTKVGVTSIQKNEESSSNPHPMISHNRNTLVCFPTIRKKLVSKLSLC